MLTNTDFFKSKPPKKFEGVKRVSNMTDGEMKNAVAAHKFNKKVDRNINDQRKFHEKSVIDKRIKYENDAFIARIDLYLAQANFGVGGQMKKGLWAGEMDEEGKKKVFVKRPPLYISREFKDGNFIIEGKRDFDTSDVDALLRSISLFVTKGDHENKKLVLTFSEFCGKEKVGGSEIQVARKRIDTISSALMSGERRAGKLKYEWVNDKAFYKTVDLKSENGKKAMITIVFADHIADCALAKDGWSFSGVSLLERDLLNTPLAKNLHLFLSSWIWKIGASTEKLEPIFLQTLANRSFPAMNPIWDDKRVKQETNKRRSLVCKALKLIGELENWAVDIIGEGSKAKADIVMGVYKVNRV